jgi:hypothetical protein
MSHGSRWQNREKVVPKDCCNVTEVVEQENSVRGREVLMAHVQAIPLGTPYTEEMYLDNNESRKKFKLEHGKWCMGQNIRCQIPAQEGVKEAERRSLGGPETEDISAPCRGS